MLGIVARVEVYLYPPEKSGKTVGYKSGVRPNHFIHELGCTVIGSINFEPDEGIDLGERKMATITYLSWEPFVKVLSPGLIYEIREGERTVGEAHVIEVVQ